MTIETIGYGAGARDFSGHANVLRISVGDLADDNTLRPGTQAQQEADCHSGSQSRRPESAAYWLHLEQALAAGALDVFTTPVQMKKSRPGTLITVLAQPEDEQRCATLLFRESDVRWACAMREEKRAVLLRALTKSVRHAVGRGADEDRRT